jgi:hypothetical protein
MSDWNARWSVKKLSMTRYGSPTKITSCERGRRKLFIKKEFTAGPVINLGKPQTDRPKQMHERFERTWKVQIVK